MHNLRAYVYFLVNTHFISLKICYGGDVPVSYYCKENYKVDSLTEESYQVGCVKQGTALKLSFEVESAGSVLR